jgi:hypothetical protein
MMVRIEIGDSETRQKVKIGIKDPKEDHKTLGTHQNPACYPAGQAKILAQKEKKMTAFFQHSKMPKYKVHLAYNSMYTKCIQFPLGVTLMDYDLADKISK